MENDLASKESNGLASHLFFEGILKMGAPFAVGMQVIGYFVLRGENQTFGEYFSSSTTWVTFFLHATLFGSIMGFITWRRKQRGAARNNIDLGNSL